MTESPILHARELRSQVIGPVCGRYPGKEELVELLALVLCAAENLLIVGPPGTAKSELVSEFASRLGGRYFEYLLTRFTEPSEIFGPVDLARLREGKLATSTEGMLPEAEIAFLDELFHAGSAILNTLLGILNDGVYRRGSELRRTELISAIAATNRLVDEPSLRALQDRFTLRIEVSSLGEERTMDLLRAGWEIEKERLLGEPSSRSGAFTTAKLRAIQRAVAAVELTAIRGPLGRLVHRIRATGVFLSDRRAVKLQRLAAASAVLSGRSEARVSDLWPARYVWESEEDRELLEDIVEESITDDAPRGPEPAGGADHPLATRAQRPAELLAALTHLEAEIESLKERPAAETTDKLYNKIHDIDRQRRWCIAQGPDDETRLRELETRIDFVSEALARKEDHR